MPADRPHLTTPHGTLFDTILSDHLLGTEDAGRTLLLSVDQVLLQDATGTLVIQALDALGRGADRSIRAVQYVDHNLMQGDFRNADDQRYLREAAAALGIVFSPAGNGISHPLHMENFGIPGAVLVGSDSHTCAAGAIGMLAVGCGSLTVAAALSGEPLRIERPRSIGVRLAGTLPAAVSAKDVILELLRRIGTEGAVDAVVEFGGPGVATLSAWDRHVIANMCAETGATCGIFPSDEVVRAFLAQVGRAADWREVRAAPDARYDESIEIDLSALVPLIALPSDPGQVVPVTEVEGTPLHQTYLGSSANPGFRDFAVAAAMLGGERIAPNLSFEVNPTSRTQLNEMIKSGVLAELIGAGGRVHQTGCNGCNGMGQAPGTGMKSLRTVPRNFPGRSGTKGDRIYLASPETVAASSLHGCITDPRRYAGRIGQAAAQPQVAPAARAHFVQPAAEGAAVERFVGPNIVPLPQAAPFQPLFDLPVLLHVGDGVSTDAISPAGAAALPFRSNLAKLADFTFRDLAPDYVAQARAQGDHALTAGLNYGQGSSREHAALCPRHLGLRLVLARSFARIHRQNLVSAGVLPLLAPAQLDLDSVARIGLDYRTRRSNRIDALVTTAGGEERRMTLICDLSEYEAKVLEAGGLLRLLGS